jgi:hypothetical protein
LQAVLRGADLKRLVRDHRSNYPRLAPFREATRDGIWTAAASQWSPKQTAFFANRQLVQESHCKHNGFYARAGVELEVQKIKTIGDCDWSR